MEALLRLGRVTAAPLSSIYRWAGATGWVALVAMGCVLLARRLAGFLTEPLPSLGIVVFGCFLAALSASLFWIAGRTRLKLNGAWKQTIIGIGWLPAAAAVSLPGTAPWALVLFWSILVVNGAIQTAVPRIVRWRQSSTPVTRGAAPESSTDVEADDTDEPAALADEVHQELTRKRDAAGADLLVGRLRAAFETGQKTQVLHVAFCPPFGGSPEIEIEALEGDDVTIVSSQAFSYGMRLEVRRRNAVKAGSTVLAFSASFTPAPRDFR